MGDVDRDWLKHVAEQCVSLVREQTGQTLDYSLDSLTVLDAVCEGLLTDGPLPEDRLTLWWKLVGSYTGEVMIGAYDGEWIDHERAPGCFAISASGMTGFPFALADRVLRGEPYKSLVSFGRVWPALAEHTNPNP